MRISQLEGRRVGLWGWGREGRAAHAAIRARLPSLPLTLLCSAAEALQAQALGDTLLRVVVDDSATELAALEIVVKSPGISPYGDAARAAAASGTQFIGGSTLWFDEHESARTVCVTGTKGKSTSTALIAHLLRSAGHRTALAGNIGLSLLEVPDAPAPDFWAIELSSYQTLDVAAASVRPEVAVVLNLFPEHLDWHGSQERYIEDKLSLVTAAQPRITVLNAEDARLATVGEALSALPPPHGEVRWFNRPDGWHLRGDAVYRGDDFVLDAREVPLPGRHNRGNLCAALAAIEALGVDATTLAAAALHFVPLPNRLQTLGMRGGITYVNDSISTTPHASLAALDCFDSARVVVVLGGHDRGVEWESFAERMRSSAPAGIVTMGDSGPRIHALLRPVAAEAGFPLAQADGLREAIDQAQAMLEGNGTVLLSPGAPSFGQYTDYQARGRDFARLAGFDESQVGHIAGLGVG